VHQEEEDRDVQTDRERERKIHVKMMHTQVLDGCQLGVICGMILSHRK